MSDKPHQNLAVIGHVDHGKSTLVGRLLFETGAVEPHVIDQYRKEAEELGLDKIFLDAGFEWRESGCSMCLGMNPDTLKPGERCASTSNRNFEGRQGRGGRTHLVSPATAAGAAIAGHFVDIREWLD